MDRLLFIGSGAMSDLSLLAGEDRKLLFAVTRLWTGRALEAEFE